MRTTLVALVLALTLQTAARAESGWLAMNGKDKYVRITNGATTVVLDPYVGGRVIEYSLNGVNSLYRAPEKPAPGEQTFTPDAGRIDIGPEQIIPRHPEFWEGEWYAEITGDFSARFTSVVSLGTGVRLVRDFKLDPKTSRFLLTQTIKNVSKEVKNWNHWSRTLATGHGICVVPISKISGFPRGYIYYGPGSVLTTGHAPTPAIELRDETGADGNSRYLIIRDTPPQPKFGVDSYAGWLAYLETNNLCIVKRFPTYPERAYGEVGGYTISLWYYKDTVCELEPTGPREFIKPGGKASFTEEWWLVPYTFPQDRNVDIQGLTALLENTTRK